MFKKLFCSHTWLSFRKKEYKWKEKEIVKGTEWWFTPELKTQDFSETVEILQCEKCGKIK